jgi:hypothetical protein
VRGMWWVGCVTYDELQQGTARWTDPLVVSRVKGRAAMNPVFMTWTPLAAASSTTLIYASLVAYGDSSSSSLRALTSHDEVRPLRL